MNKLFFIVVVAFLALQNVESAPKNQNQNSRRSQQNAVQEGDIEKTVVEKTKELIKSADEALTGNLPDSKQIISKFEETGQNLVDSIKNFNDLIKKTLKNNEGQIDSTLKQISDNLKTAKDNLEQKILGADGQKKAQEIRDAVNKTIRESASQIGKLGDTFKPEAEKVKNDILTGAKAFLDNAEKFTNDLKTHVADSQKQ